MVEKSHPTSPGRSINCDTYYPSPATQHISYMQCIMAHIFIESDFIENNTAHQNKQTACFRFAIVHLDILAFVCKFACSSNSHLNLNQNMLIYSGGYWVAN